MKRQGGSRAAGLGRGLVAASFVVAGACYSTDSGWPADGQLDDGSAGTSGTRNGIPANVTAPQPFAPTNPVSGPSSSPRPVSTTPAPQPVATPTAPTPVTPPEALDPEPVASDDDAGVVVPGDHDLGRPCNPAAAAECQWDTCYIPGATDNPICSKLCAADADCPADAACIFPANCGGSQNACDGLGYCFVRCDQDAQCQAINATPVNPLTCVAHPKDGFEGEPVDVCIESSEP